MDSQIQAAEKLVGHLRQNGGTFHPSLILKNDETTGLSTFSSSQIGPEERLVSCPFEVAITPNNATVGICASTSVEEGKLVWAQGQWNERMRICAYICLHWCWNEQGRSLEEAGLNHWWYINSLPGPDTMRTPLFFTTEELLLLEGTNLAGAVEDRRREWQAEFEAVQGVLNVDGLTWERYLLASTWLSSRAFPSKLLQLPADGVSTSTSAVNTSEEEESHPVLLPGVDILNHSRAQPIIWLSSPLPSSSGPIPSISLMSSATIPQNEQVFNNYGAKSNEEFLFGYGFVLDPNPDDTVILRLGKGSIPPEVEKRIRAKGLEVGKRFLLRRDGELDKELLEVVRILLSGGQGVSTHDHDHDHEDEDEDEHLAHQKEEQEMQLELDVLGMLGQMLEDKLNKLQEGAQELEGVRQDVKSMCDGYRRGQIEIIETTMDKLEERIERIERLLEEGMGCPCGC